MANDCKGTTTKDQGVEGERHQNCMPECMSVHVRVCAIVTLIVEWLDVCAYVCAIVIPNSGKYLGWRLFSPIT